MDFYEEQVYIKKEETASKQKRTNRLNSIDDKRVHLMLYFFGSGHHTNASDFTMLQSFQNLVNVIPVIAKADSFKPNELLKLKIDIIETAEKRKVAFFDCFEAIEEVSLVSQKPRIIDQEVFNHLVETLLNHSSPSEKGEHSQSLGTTHGCPPFAIINPDDKQI